MIVVGISGKKRAGKDTICHFIKEWGQRHHWDVERRAFADSLKEEVCRFLTCELIRSGEPPVDAARVAEFEVYTDTLKEGIRPVLQWWGGWRRETLGADYWITRLDESLAKPPPYPATLNRRIVVIPDVRMANEFAFIRRCGGVLIRVDRSALDRSDTHLSETDLDGRDDWDWRARNDGSLDDLKQRVFEFCAARQWGV